MRKGSRSRSLFVRAGWGLGAALLVAGSVPAAFAQDSRVSVIDRIPLNKPGNMTQGITAAGTMYLNPEARHGYQIYPLLTGETLFREIDLDTLEVIERYSVPIRVSQPACRSAPA